MPVLVLCSAVWPAEAVKCRSAAPDSAAACTVWTVPDVLVVEFMANDPAAVAAAAGCRLPAEEPFLVSFLRALTGAPWVDPVLGAC